ncbi:MAG: hypothetical protein PWP04_1034, partial [Candidatus Atribacteria bacterium]|nr:hypothetical protein [Candidatus Atribacteria bacterium]
QDKGLNTKRLNTYEGRNTLPSCLRQAERLKGKYQRKSYRGGGGILPPTIPERNCKDFKDFKD